MRSTAPRRAIPGLSAALLLAGLAVALLGALAMTGHWPGGTGLQRFQPNGILPEASAMAERVAIAAGGERVTFRRKDGGWAPEGSAADDAGDALARHVETGLRFLAVSPPLRVIGAGEIGAVGLASFGLVPPGMAVTLTGARGDVIARIGFGTPNPAQTSQYVRVEGRPEVYLMPRHVGAEWALAADRARRAAEGAGRGQVGAPLLPVSVAQLWAIEIVAGGDLVRFERDDTGAWFRHVGQHVHRGPSDAHHADPEQARRIAVELAAFERATVAREVAAVPDAGTLARTGLARPSVILLLYARDNPMPVARLDIGGELPDGGLRHVRLHDGGPAVAVAAKALAHLAALQGIAAP